MPYCSGTAESVQQGWGGLDTRAWLCKVWVHAFLTSAGSTDCTWLAADPKMDSGLGLEFFLVALSAWYRFHACTISSLQVCSSWVPRAWYISYLSATWESKCSHYVWASWTREGHWHPGRGDSDMCHTPLSCSSCALVQSSSQAVVEVVLHWHCCGNRLVLCLIHWLEEVQRVRVLSPFNEGRVSHEKQHQICRNILSSKLPLKSRGTRHLLSLQSCLWFEGCFS